MHIIYGGVMEKYKKINQASILGIIGNLFLLIIKGIIGFITNSQAMIADCLNSAGDILSSFMTFVGNKVASKPCDDDHNLGHGKAEYIYSLLISITMILVISGLLITSIKTLFIKNNYVFSIWLIIICLITILTKFLLYLYTKKIANRYDNILIKANSIDHKNDCVITLLTLIASLFSLVNIYFIDSIIGILISLWLFISALKIFKDSYDVLMDKSIDENTKSKVLDIINNHKEIVKINHFNSTPVGYKYQISFTIFVDGNLKTFESHDIADKLEKEIIKKINEIYLVVIHVNPIKIKDI